MRKIVEVLEEIHKRNPVGEMEEMVDEPASIGRRK